MRPRTAALPALALLLALAPAPAAAQEAAAGSAAGDAAAAPALGILPARGPIRIDADTTDPGWAGAARVSAFVELRPREGAAPPVETEVLLAYDEAHLYLAFVARDPEPSRIRATLQPRDRLANDDWVGVLLDPYGDASLGYYLKANPLGVQADLQVTPQREDDTIDFVYATAGAVTGEGYVVEMAIPFRSLRVPARPVRSWGVMVVRSLPRSSSHFLTWPALSRNNACQLCQVGRLEGVEGIRAGGGLDLLPALVASRGGRLQDPADPASYRTEPGRAEPSLGVRYAFQRGWAAEATLNPDFSQVESDAAQVDVNTTFALFYPERRPFFQEGMDLYQTPLSVFYSRSINAPSAAAKLSGRAGSTSIGYIGARDEDTPFIVPFRERTGIVQAGPSFTNVLRVRQNLAGSHLGALLTDRRMDGGGSGTTLSADGLYRISEVYTLTGQLVLSHTREPEDARLSAQLPELRFGGPEGRHSAALDGESYAGHASWLYLARDARTWSWNVLYLGISPTYRADTGFESRNDFRRATGWTGYSLYPNRYGIEQVTASLWGGAFWSFGGETQQRVINPGIRLLLPRQTEVVVQSTLWEETFGGVHFPALREYGFWLTSSLGDAVQLSVELGTGRRIARTLAVPQLGSGRTARVSATLKPLYRIVVEPSLSYERLRLPGGEEVFSGYIARSRFNFQYDRALHFRLVAQYNDFRERVDVEPLLVYQLNPFSIFYVGSTFASREFDPQGMVGTDRQYFVKLQYLFRR